MRCEVTALDRGTMLATSSAEQRKSQRGLLVRLGEDGRRRLLEDLIPDERGRVVGHIRVGDASFGSLRDVGDGRCHVSSDLKATESGADRPGNLIDGIQVVVDLTLSQERVGLRGQAHPGYRLQAVTVVVVVVVPLPSSTLAVLPLSSAVTRSFTPSPLKSPTATD